MVNILDYINLSKTSNEIVNVYSTSNQFRDYYYAVSDSEKRSIIRHFIINNVPHVFKEKPVLYEQLIQYFADKLQISTNDIKLIGSAKTGFSISPPPNYGKKFGSHSDLDFSIINSDIFFTLEAEFNTWANQYKNKEISSTAKQELYWNQNLYEVPKYQLKNGFIDSYKIPNRSNFPTTQKLNNSLFLISTNLNKFHSIEVKGASARVYKSWDSFSKKVNQNIDIVLKKIS
ncbi:hypothetical protein EON73_02255 [bacterium]|nr:MAG: hypothetical protein EON73_02255 [bacterium]